MTADEIAGACATQLGRPEYAHVLGVGVAADGRRRLAGPAPTVPTNAFSVTKAVTAAAVLAAVDDGVLAGLDDTLLVLRDTAPHVTVHDLLCMRARWHHEPDMDALETAAGDPLTVIAAELAPPTVGSGGAPRYVNAASHLLVRELHARTGSAGTYVRERVLAPAGLDDADWDLDQTGVPWGHAHLLLSTENLLQLGLYWLSLPRPPWRHTCGAAPTGPEGLPYAAGFWHGGDVVLAAGWGGQCLLVHLPTGSVLAALARTGWSRATNTDTLPAGWASGRRLFEEHALPLLRR